MSLIWFWNAGDLIWPDKLSRLSSWSCSPAVGSRTASRGRPRSCSRGIRPQGSPVSGLGGQYSIPQFGVTITITIVIVIVITITITITIIIIFTVKAVVPATVCRSMSEILHSPVATLNVADLRRNQFLSGFEIMKLLFLGKVLLCCLQTSLPSEERQKVCI